MDIRAPVQRAEAAELPADVVRALDRLADEPLGDTVKGIPFGSNVTIRTVGDAGWNVLAEDLPLPVITLDSGAVAHNIGLMQGYADANGALLAPHGKTTMAPQIWAQQLQAGAWGICVANAAQLQVAAAFGVPRVIYANEPVTEYEFRLPARQLNLGREVYALVDDPTTARRLALGLANAGAQAPLPVLVEVGVAGGRTGARSVDEAVALGRLVRDQVAQLTLAGVENFEGTASFVRPDDPVPAVDEFLERLLDVATELSADRAADPGSGEFLVSAGGSGFFDRVIDVIGRGLPAGCRLVLRPGTYITHDAGTYDRISPLGRGTSARLTGARLEPALMLWTVVLSRPEPDLAILNAGRRDSPADGDAPWPKLWAPTPSVGSAGPRKAVPFPGSGSIFAANDQHMYMRLDAGSPVKPGDLVGLAVSHPCLVMDRWGMVLVSASDGSVTGAVRTFF